MASGRFHPRVLRVGVAALAVLGVSALFLQRPGHSQGADAATTQASANVAVIPGFTAPKYPGFFGVSAFPAGAPQLSAYHFSQLPTDQVTLSALNSYDTAILYGLRWSDISASGQAAINAFAATHKVVIWDADGTGSQNYSTFIHPFSDQSSGEDNSNPTASVVSFPQNGTLASDNSSSPYYLDPNQLVSDRDEINHMNAMTTGTANWLPALVAANSKIPNGGWTLAWSYGVIGNHTGMTIYSGIDADTFGDTKLNPNNAIKELALQLQAQFRTTPDPACAPGCGLGDSGGGSGGGGSGGGGSSGPPHAACSIEKAPHGWVHGRVPVVLKTSEAAGITGRVLTPTGRVVATGNESGELIRFRVNTRPLRSNHASGLRALVYVKGQQACSTSFRLKVDNTPPRLLSLRTSTLGQTHLVSLRVSEKSSMRILGAGRKHSRPILIAAHRLVRARLGGNVHHASLILRDRAGNTVRRKLAW